MQEEIKNKSPNHQQKVIQTFIKEVAIYEEYLKIYSIVDTAYGGEGSRTPVQKPSGRGLYHHIHCFDIPSAIRPVTGL